MVRHYKKRKNKNNIDFHDFQKLEVEGLSFKPTSKWKAFLNFLWVVTLITFSILIWL